MSISLTIILVARASMPGSPAIIAGMGMEGLPRGDMCKWSTFLSFTMSKPQKVKKIMAS